MSAKDRTIYGVFSPGPRPANPATGMGFRSPLREAAGRPGVLAGRILAALTLALLAGPVCWAQTVLAPAKVIVDDVVVRGNNTIPTAKIMGLIRTHPGGEYKANEVEEDVRRLVESRLLRDVKVWKSDVGNNRVVVNFICTEYPALIREVIYKNAGHLKPDELDSITGLRKGAPLNPAACKQACVAIQDRYHEMGRLLASVELEEGGKPGDTRVVFNITEGRVVRIHKISIVGGTFVSTARFKTQIDSSTAFLGLLGGVYDERKISHDVAKLEEYCRNFGFQKAQVSREVVFISESKVDVIFHINEGPRYQVEGVYVEGAKSLDPAYLASIPRLHQGETYNHLTSEKDQRNIKDAYGWRGQEAVVQERVVVDDQKPGFLQVHYEITEKPPARVGQVIIIGNTVTQDRVIRHEIGLFPGQVLSYPELRLAEANLARRNIFEVNPETGVRPTVTVLDNETDSDIKDILVQVKETHTGSLMFGIGVNSDAGLVGSIVLNERNFDILRPPTSFADILEGRAFRGAGEEFRAEAVPGTQLQRYTVSFREPYLFDTLYALSLSGYYYDRIYPEYTERRVGSRVTVDRRLNQYWTASAGFRVEGIDVADVPFFAPIQVSQFAGQHFLFAPRIGVRRDTRDSYLRPTEGSQFEVSAEQAFGDYTFPIFNMAASKYWTMFQRPDGSGRQVLAFRTQVDYAGSNAPIYERFYAGGFQSLRGFEFRGVGPDVDGFKIGGDFMFLNSLEYQIPVRANDQLYFVAFVDSGTVEPRVEIKDYRVSAGFGARIVVPMLGPVPIALDFGFPIVKGPNDKEQVFSFGVGMFR
jgi:outer membrane protein assembly complex protein YaeT